VKKRSRPSFNESFDRSYRGQRDQLIAAHLRHTAGKVIDGRKDFLDSFSHDGLPAAWRKPRTWRNPRRSTSPGTVSRMDPVFGQMGELYEIVSYFASA
jgi:hypothetical protein